MSEELPVILVSAADIATADGIITEIINNEVATNGTTEDSNEERIWLLSNKYYRARVRLRARGDEGAGSGEGSRPAEAHVVYLAAGELTAETLERRAAAPAAAASAVRLALCQLSAGAAGPPEPLLAAAHALRYEPVPVPAEPVAAPDAGGPFPELQGVARAREALHAHPWPGLRLLAPPAGSSDSEREEGEEEEEEEGGEGDVSEAECVRRAELFAEALGVLEAARDLRVVDVGEGAGAGAGAGRDPERLLRAERLLHAFAAAIGTDLDRL